MYTWCLRYLFIAHPVWRPPETKTKKKSYQTRFRWMNSWWFRCDRICWPLKSFFFFVGDTVRLTVYYRESGIETIGIAGAGGVRAVRSGPFAFGKKYIECMYVERTAARGAWVHRGPRESKPLSLSSERRGGGRGTVMLMRYVSRHIPRLVGRWVGWWVGTQKTTATLSRPGAIALSNIYTSP